MPPSAIPSIPERAGAGVEERRLAATFRARYADVAEELVVHSEISSPIASLVVVSYRPKADLLDCLRRLRNQTDSGPFEVILVDCGGLEPFRARVGGIVDVELRLQSGVPLNVARNAAMGWARGELVAFIDDDGMIEPSWLTAARDVFSDPSVGVARGRILPLEHPLYNAFVVHYDRGDEPWEDESLATEGNMMIRRAVHLAVEGFPDDLYGLEGCALVMRMKRAFPELRSLYAPGMVMRHDYCRSMREFVWKARRYKDKLDVATEGDPELRSFVERYMRAPKPIIARSPLERVARVALSAAERLIRRVPLFDRVTRD